MRIGIIGAMDEEIAPIKKQLKNLKETSLACQQFLSGAFGKHNIILLKSGVGKVNAALGATLLNQLWQPDYVINIGSAGGLNPDAQIGDLIIGAKISYYDVDLTAFGYQHGQCSQLPAYYASDTALINLSEKCARNLKDLSLKKGLIVSGDTFLNSKAKAELILEKFPEALAAEMEACAISQVCYLFHTPFIIIRSISDLVGAPDNKKTHEKFLEHAAQNSACLTLALLESLTSIA